MALARAHTLLAEGRWSGASLAELVTAELAAFAVRQVSAGGPQLRLAPAAAQAVSMALHELATNATKYGALSVPGGSLAVAWGLDGPADRLRFRWVESGGPAIATPPDSHGFGSRMIRATIEEQLGGSLATRWEAEGLVCEFAVPISRGFIPTPPEEAPPAASPARVAWPSS
jgi:two-component sensor histidine kinase